MHLLSMVCFRNRSSSETEEQSAWAFLVPWNQPSKAVGRGGSGQDRTDACVRSVYGGRAALEYAYARESGARRRPQQKSWPTTTGLRVIWSPDAAPCCPRRRPDAAV